MGFVWIVCGFFVVCRWFVCGLYVVCMWFVCGLYVVCMDCIGPLKSVVFKQVLILLSHKSNSLH